MQSLFKKSFFAAFLLFFCFAPKGLAAQGYSKHDLLLEKQGFSLQSAILHENEAFNAVSIQLDEVVEGLMVNFNPVGGGEWEEVEIHDDGFGAETLVFSSPTHTVQFKKKSLFSAEPLRLKVHLFHRNTEETAFGGPPSSTENLVAATENIAAGSFRVIPRKEWGADETLRYWNPEWDDGRAGTTSGGYTDPCESIDEDFAYEIGITHVTNRSPAGDILTWPLQHMSKVRKIIVHHTDSELKDLNGDRRLDTRDYKEILQAIYYYHTISRGWGDIGYNFIIDPLGNIYEGRYGGDKVIGAHALCHNNGALGIAIIGNYQDDKVPEPAMRSLVSLIASESKKFGIDPEGYSSFRGKTASNILGHRDVRATSCPGKNLYKELSAIRDRSALALRSGIFKEGSFQVENLDYNAQLVGGLPQVVLEPNERKKVTLLFKNIGQKAWDQNTWLHVALNNHPDARIIPLIEDKAFVAADLKEHSVAPGKTGTFELEIEGGYRGGEYSFEISPVVNGRYKVSRSSEYLSFNVKRPRFSYEVVSKDMPSGTIFQGQKILASMDLKNTGNITWKNFGPNQITLGTSGPRDRKSIFIKQNPARMGYMVDSEVAPGEVGRFVMELEVPLEKSGFVVEQFTPVIENVAWLEDKALGFRVAVKEPIHLARMTKLNQVTRMTPGEMRKIELEVENKGDLAWDADNMQITLLGRGLKVFKTKLVPTETVPPKDKTTLSFWVQAPYEKGKYTVFLRSRFNKIPIRGGTARYIIDIPETKITAENTNTDSRYVILRPGEEEEVTLTFKNTGNTIWRKKGENAIFLGTSAPTDRLSQIYYEEGWENKFRPAAMKEDEVSPGETATFTFKVRPGDKGIYNETFQLVAEGVGWLEGSEVSKIFRVFGEPILKQLSADVTQSGTQSKSAPKVSQQQLENAKKITTPRVSRIIQNPVVTTVEKETLPAVSAKERPFRVRLSYGEKAARITANNLFKVEDGKGNTLFSLATRGEISIKRLGSNFHVQYGELIKSSPVVRFIPQGDSILEVASWEHRPTWNENLNDNRFRGIVEVRLVDNKVAYINELPLEDYLKGLAEVSNDAPFEKQKTIAVLARTYARFYMEEANRKFPGLPYDGSDDPAVFQRYLGYGFETRSPDFIKAVNQTEDQVVIYEGDLVKTPYFNQSDGRTRSAKEVWGWTNTPYLQSVQDPWSNGQSLNGHGVGLSGLGATKQAEEGKEYDEIIKYYYLGVEIGKLDFSE